MIVVYLISVSNALLILLILLPVSITSVSSLLLILPAVVKRPLQTIMGGLDLLYLVLGLMIVDCVGFKFVFLFSGGGDESEFMGFWGFLFV